MEEGLEVKMEMEAGNGYGEAAKMAVRQE